MSKIYKALVKLRDNGPVDRIIGICYNTTMIDESIDPIFFPTWCRSKFRSWMMKEDFPIEGAYLTYLLNDKKWDPTTEYGQRRWDLLDKLIIAAQFDGV